MVSKLVAAQVMVGGAVTHPAATPELKVTDELVPVRENCTPGSVGVWSGNWSSYRDGGLVQVWECL